MDFAMARRQMVDCQVRPNDVTDQRLQAAMETIPREVFLPEHLRDQAYVEREIAYAPGRTLLMPRDFAKLAAVATPQETDLVLNAVAGTGYSTAILAQLVDMVVAVESDEALATAAQENLTSLGVSNAAILHGDCTKGAADQGAYDLIFIGGAIEIQPQGLLAQLKDGGRLATILLADKVSRGVVYQRNGDAFTCIEKFDASTKSVLPGFAVEKAFVF